MNTLKRILSYLVELRRTIALVALTLVGMLVALPGPARAQNAYGSSASITAKGPTVVHDQAFAGAAINVQLIPIANTQLSLVVLEVSGMPKAVSPRTLGAHVHVAPCAADAASSGPHHQNPAAAPSVPLGAKEVWLDLRIDSLGRAVAVDLIDWPLRKGQAGSVVIHELPTNQTTGTAGARLLCTSVPFAS